MITPGVVIKKELTEHYNKEQRSKLNGHLNITCMTIVAFRILLYIFWFSNRFWNLAAAFCFHSGTWALVRSNTDVEKQGLAHSQRSSSCQSCWIWCSYTTHWGNHFNHFSIFNWEIDCLKYFFLIRNAQLIWFQLIRFGYLSVSFVLYNRILSDRWLEKN